MARKWKDSSAPELDKEAERERKRERRGKKRKEGGLRQKDILSFTLC